MIINKDQAKVVRRIFREFEEGRTPPEIAKHLNDEKIKGVRGKVAWNGATIRAMLENEKHMGDSMLQKTYTVDFLSKKRAKNEGQIAQYYVENSHEGIIPKEEWRAVQLEMERRYSYCREVGINHFGCAVSMTSFTSRLVCGRCGIIYRRYCWKNRGIYYWACKRKEKLYGGTCKSENVKDEIIRKAFVNAWNSVVKERYKKMVTWEEI